MHAAFELYHVGILVEDIEEAMARYGRELGLTFLEPITYRVGDRDVRLTFNTGEPPLHELLEANGSALYPHGQEGLHHLGYWTPDPEAAVARVEAAGYTPLTVERGEDGKLLLAYYEAPGLGRIELVDPAMSKPFLAAWAAGAAPGRS